MWNSSALLAIPADIPVDPSAVDARRWAEEELARDVYNPQQSIFTKIGQWFMSLLEDLFSGHAVASNPVAAAVIAALIIALIVFLSLNWTRVRRIRHASARAAASHELFDDARSAAELRRDAEAALRAGDLNTAFLEFYRALIRSLDERVLIEDRPGLTAREAAAAATVPFPAFEGTWYWAASVFDAVRYGHTQVRPADVDQLTNFDRQVGATRPRLVEAGA